MESTLSQFAAEERRIRAAYARRPAVTWHNWSNPAYTFVLQDLERHLLRLLPDCGLASLRGKRILEVGCGAGHWLREFVKWGAWPSDVVGVDLLLPRLTDARNRSAGDVKLFCGSGASLALRDAAFDLVAQFTVFTSILDPTLKRQVAFEMLRVLKRGGLVIWYDFRFDNPQNRDVRGVKKREIHALFPGCSIKLRRVTLAPPIVRRLARVSWFLCSCLDLIPFLRTHYLAVVTKP